jgi:hypothetical protein
MDYYVCGNDYDSRRLAESFPTSLHLTCICKESPQLPIDVAGDAWRHLRTTMHDQYAPVFPGLYGVEARDNFTIHRWDQGMHELARSGIISPTCLRRALMLNSILQSTSTASFIVEMLKKGTYFNCPAPMQLQRCGVRVRLTSRQLHLDHDSPLTRNSPAGGT